MPSTGICGSTGSIGLGGEITKWTVTLNLETPDATSMASGGNREYISCLKDAEFSFESLTSCGSVGSSASMTFTNDDGTITFDGIIEQVTVKTDVDGVVTWSYSGKSTGEIT